MEFAKLFEFDDIGQVLITTGIHDDNCSPIVALRCEYEGITATPSWAFSDNDKGLNLRDEYFDSIDRTLAYELASNIINFIKKRGSND